ncbi:MAG: UDP-N-acetylglucosamine--undecaprenyl-phosphate N-acetylglucosaminephosphotransferase [Pseudomonadales bacterium]|nr:UDP-N-acetylglucosamine--undecaprenyl-phosphate N-acetylglucosaminephosphotransferase [Pseudomonadales bacterium]
MEVIVAVLMSFCSVFVLKPVAEWVGLVDKPNARKQHEGAIPLIGGVAVYLATLTACVLVFPENTFIHLFLLSSGLIVFLGVLDDYMDLSVRLRLAAQVGIACILIYGANRYISVLGDLVGFGIIDMGWGGVVFTVIAVIGAINAFNMTDGIDGLAGSLALNTFLSIAVLMYLSGAMSMIALPIILSLAILPYLFFNLGLIPGPVKKVFMGDAGSMFIGLSVVWLLVVGTQSTTPAFRPVTALWIIAIPLMDMAAIIMRRLRKGQSPFSPDRDHLHHIFMRAGFGSEAALFIIVVFSVIYSTIGIMADRYNVPEWIMFLGFMILFSIYNYGISHAFTVTRWIRKRHPKTAVKVRKMR